jgi:N-acetylneuraminate lyase
MSKLIRGIVPALCTPFDDDDNLAVDRVPGLIKSLLDANVAGFFVCGSTGEGQAMTVPERKQMAEAVIPEVAGAVPVMMHVGATTTENAVVLAKHAAETGADAVSAIAPIDAPDDFDAALDHYSAIGEATDLPFYVYWFPSSGDRSMTAERFLEGMERVKNFVGFKFTDMNFYLFNRLVDSSGGRLNAITGPDEMCVAGMIMGSDGAVGSTYNIMPRIFIEMHEAFHSGNIQAAMDAQVKANRVLSVLIKVGTVSAIKQILAWKGTPVGDTRAPRPRITDEGREILRQSLDAFDFDVV